MDPNDPDSGHPTPRDDEDELDATTQSQFVPMVTSTPKEATRIARLNLHSDQNPVREEEGSSQTSHNDPDSPGQRLKKNIQYTKLQRELKKEKSKTEKLKRENDEVMNENSILKSNLDTSMASIDDRDATIEALNESLTNLKETYKFTADVEVLKLNEEEAERELGVYRGDNDKLKKSMIEKDDRLQQLQEELEGAQSLATHKADENIQLSSTIMRTRQQLETLKQEYAQLSKKYEDEKKVSLKAQDELSRQLQDKAAEYESFRTDYMSRNKIITEENRKVNASLEELIDKNSELESLISNSKTEESTLLDSIKSLQDNVSDYKKSCDDWKREADQCKKDIEALEKERNNLNNDVSSKTTEITQLTIDFQKIQLDLSETTDKLSQQTPELNSLKEREKDFLDAVQKMKEAKDQNKILEDELRSKSITLKEQEELIQQLQEKAAELDTTSTENETFRSDYMSRNKMLTEDIKKMNASLEETRQKELQLMEVQRQLKNEIDNKDSEINKLCCEIDGLKGDATGQLEESARNLRELIDKNTELELLTFNLKAEKSSLLDRTNALQDYVSDYKKSCDDWKREADQCKIDIETLEKERNILNTDVSAKTAENAQLSIDFLKLQHDLSEATDKLSQQTPELNNLKEREKDFLDAVQKMKAAKDQNKILEEELRSKSITLKKHEELIRPLQEKAAEFVIKSEEFETFRNDYLDRIKLLTAANAQAKVAIEKAREMENQMISDQVQLRNELSAKKNEIENLNREIVKSKEAEQNLTEQLNGDKEISDMLTDERRKSSQLLDRLAEFEKINRGLADENSYLRDHFGNRPHPDQVASLQQEIQKKTGELEDIKKERREWLEKRERLNSELLARKEELENKKNEIESLLDDIIVANDEIAKQKDIICKLVQEHTDFEEDVQQREAEYEAALIRLQQLEALDGYPGRSIEVDNHDESMNTRESQKNCVESLVRESESLRSTLDFERSRIRELNSDLRKKNNECRDLIDKLEFAEKEFSQAELNVEHYRHQLNTVELSLTERDAQLRRLIAENNTNQLAFSEMKNFLMVDHPREVHDFEQKIRLLNAEVERQRRQKIVLDDDIENKDEQIYGLHAKLQQLERDAREVKEELLRTRQLISRNQDNVRELLKKMQAQDRFIERIRDRNGERKQVIVELERKLEKAYIELGRKPNWGVFPRKKERWTREEEEDNSALDTIADEMRTILREKDTEMFRSAGHNIAQESAKNSRDSENLAGIRHPTRVYKSSADASLRSNLMSSIQSHGSQARRQLPESREQEKENRRDNTTTSTNFIISHQ